MKSFFKLLLISILYISITTSCSEKISKTPFNTEPQTLADSINNDNKIYPSGTKLVFDYYIIENGDTFKCLLLNDMPIFSASSWDFVPLDSLSNVPQYFLVDKVEITVLENVFAHSQTNTQFDYIAANGKLLYTTKTGIIEDENRIWWHPLRSFYFYATEFSPFPEIQLPLRKNKTWDAIIHAGKFTETIELFGDFEGNILEVNSNYKIVGKKKMETAFGELNCIVTEAKAITKFSESTLTSYFDEKYGFVRWDYTLIDNKRLVFDLISRTSD